MNNDTEAMQLKPCDFCGISYTDISNRYTDNYQVHCMGCGADGPTSTSLDGAIAAWNNRTPSLAAQDGLVDKAKLRDAIEAAITQRAIEIIRGDNESDLQNCLEQYAEVATAAALASIEVKS